MDKEAVEMFAAPIEGTLKNFVEFGDSGVACHEITPLHQWTHATKHDAKLVGPFACYIEWAAKRA